MKKKLLLQLLLSFLISCSGQDKEEKYYLHIVNKSSQTIDSICIHGNKKISEEVNAGQAKTIDIDLSNDDISGEGGFPLFIYQSDIRYTARWGFHDWGQMARKYDSIFLFDNGVNYTNKNLVKPKEFTLFLTDKMSPAIDSIHTEALKTMILKQGGGFELRLDFDKFENNPVLTIYQKDKVHNTRIEHNWKDWNNIQEFLFIYNNGIISNKGKL